MTNIQRIKGSKGFKGYPGYPHTLDSIGPLCEHYRPISKVYRRWNSENLLSDDGCQGATRERVSYDHYRRRLRPGARDIGSFVPARTADSTRWSQGGKPQRDIAVSSSASAAF